MKASLIDTNVIIRYLVEQPETIASKFSGVFTFFDKVEKGETQVYVPDLVIFETYFVLTRIYQVPQAEAAEKLALLTEFRGIDMSDKQTMRTCLRLLCRKNLDLVDAWLIAVSKHKGMEGVYSFDSDLRKNGLQLLNVQ